MRSEWTGFVGGKWEEQVDVRDFIQKNYTPYEGDDSFLCGPTEATKTLWAQVMELSKQEREKGGVLDMDTKVPSTITSHAAGYLNKDLEKIVGFQTDKPLKGARSLNLLPYTRPKCRIHQKTDGSYCVPVYCILSLRKVLLRRLLPYTSFHRKEYGLSFHVQLAVLLPRHRKIRGR